MKLIADWRHVLKHAWSVRLTVMTAALGGLELGLPVFADSIPHGPFLVLTIVVAVAAAVSRVVEQPKMRNPGASDG